MQLGMVGLGRMGANLVRRLMRGGHECVVHDVSAAAVEQLESEGETGARSLEDFVARLTPPRAAWIMVPAALVGKIVDELMGHLEPGDTIIDGGNSYYRDDIERAERLEQRGATRRGGVGRPPPPSIRRLQRSSRMFRGSYRRGARRTCGARSTNPNI
jgi:6-phosphogluconate dehydrogenase